MKSSKTKLCKRVPKLDAILVIREIWATKIYEALGFLEDSRTLTIVRPVPVFDSGSSRYYENEKPESVRVTTVNGCYKTELECLQHRSGQNCVDFNKIPTRYELVHVSSK